MKPDWQSQAESYARLVDAISRADLDFYNIPVNRNIVGNPGKSRGLRRFSEFHPRHWPYPEPSVFVPPSTYGRGHLEIRPIRDQNRSLLTRATVDYRGGEVLSILPRPFRPLAIDCFTAVTPPTLEYDRSFKNRRPVKKIGRDGSVTYQNACREGRLATPFESDAEAPPAIQGSNRPDWMFYFQPVRSTLRARILERLIDRRVGALWLWASNPTYGITDAADFARLGIRYNTWPRRPDDLVRFFAPWLDAEAREALRQSAPYLNPNFEYRDGAGLRQKIPDDADTWRRLGAARRRDGLPPVPQSRGPAVDLTLGDFLQDSARLAATPADRFPWIAARLQFRPGAVLTWPGIGTIQLGQHNELNASYRIFPDKRADGSTRARSELRLDWGPVQLERVDLEVGPIRMQIAEGCKAKRMQIVVPMRQVWHRESRQWKWQVQWQRSKLQVDDLRIRGLEWREGTSSLVVKNLEIEKLTVKPATAGKSRIEISSKASGVTLDQPFALRLEVNRMQLDMDYDWASRRVARILADFKVDLQIAELKNLPVIQNFPLNGLEITPQLGDIYLKGAAKLSFDGETWKLRKTEGRLEAGASLVDTHITHRPFDEAHLKANLLHRVIQSDLQIEFAKFEVRDLEALEYRGRITKLSAGPVALHHLRGGGKVWLNTLLWSWLRGEFPHFGVPAGELPEASQTKRPKIARPDPEWILAGLDSESRDLLWDGKLGDYGNFIWVDRVSMQPDAAEPAVTRTELKNFRAYLHESGNRWQFAAIHIPAMILSPSWSADRIAAHVFLKDPKRGYSRFEIKPSAEK